MDDQNNPKPQQPEPRTISDFGPMPQADTRQQTVINPEPLASQADQPTDQSPIFTDAPVTQNQTPSQTPPPENKKSKRSKKLLFVFLFLLIATGAAAAYYFLVMNKEETTNTVVVVQPESQETIDILFYQDDKSVRAVEPKQQETNELASIPEGARAIDVSVDGKETYYVTYDKANPNDTADALKTMSVYKKTAENNELILKTKTYTAPDIAYPVLSNNKSQLAYFAYSKNETSNVAENANIYIAKLDSSNEESILVPADTDKQGPLIPLVWSEDNKSLYMGDAGCYGCDAQGSSVIWKSDIEAKTISNVFNQPENSSRGRAIVSPDKKSIAVDAGNFSMPDTFEEISEYTFSVNVIDLSSDQVTEVYSKKNESGAEIEGLQDLIGWSSDSSNVLVSVFKVKKAEGTDSDSQIDQTFDRVDAVAVADKKVSPIPIKIDALNDAFKFSATTISSQLYLVANEPQKEGQTALTYSMYNLALGQGVSEAKTIVSGSSSIFLLGYGKQAVQE